MKNRILVVVLLALTLSGCSAGGFFGRYVVLNNSGSTITNLTISVGKGNDQSWGETLPSQGWIHSNSLGEDYLIVSWTDESGDHKERFSIREKIGYRSKDDVIVELKPGGDFAWQVVAPPATDSNSWASTLVNYLLWCVAIALLVGVPLALAAAMAYGLFKAIRIGITATVQGLHGDRSVFQFTIREIFLLTTAVALALGWFVHVLTWTRN